MLSKYPIYPGGIQTAPVQQAQADLTPVIELFMRRSLMRARQGQGKAPDDPYADAKLDATRGEAAAWQQEVDKYKGTINEYRRMYGPGMEHVIQKIPEVRNAFAGLDQAYSEGHLVGLKRNRENLDAYTDRLSKEESGGLKALQLLHTKGMTGNGPATYGQVATVLKDTPKMAGHWGWYDMQHSSWDASQSMDALMKQLKPESWSANQWKSEAYTVSEAVTETIAGTYNLEGYLTRKREVPGKAGSSNRRQIENRKASLVMDKNMLHGLEQGFLQWQEKNGLYNLREGMELERAAKDGSPVRFKVGSKEYNALNKGKKFQDGSLALSVEDGVALYDADGKPNDNYMRLFEDWLGDIVLHASESNFQSNDETLRKDSGDDFFRPLEGDALEKLMRQQRLQAMIDSGNFSDSFEAQTVTDAMQDLELLTTKGNKLGKAYTIGTGDSAVTTDDSYELMLAIIANGVSEGHITDVENINSEAEMKEYLKVADKNSIMFISKYLEKFKLPPVAHAFRKDYEGVEGEYGKSEVASMAGPALNFEFMEAGKKMWGMNETGEFPASRMGMIPLVIGGVPKHYNTLADKATVQLDGSFVLNDQGARKKGDKYQYDQTGSALEYKKDFERLIYIAKLAEESPEKYQQMFDSGDIKWTDMSTVVHANATAWMAPEELQRYVDNEVVYVPKEFTADKNKVRKISNDDALAYGKSKKYEIKRNLVGGQNSTTYETILTHEGKMYKNSEAFDFIKSQMVLEDNPLAGPGTVSHTAAKRTLKGDKKFEPVGGDKDLHIKADPLFKDIYGPIQKRTLPDGKVQFGIRIKVNGNELLQRDPMLTRAVLKKIYKDQEQQNAPATDPFLQNMNK